MSGRSGVAWPEVGVVVAENKCFHMAAFKAVAVAAMGVAVHRGLVAEGRESSVGRQGL